ncbi:hypothetical protein IFM89_030505 [Coptis chinensis]|uniref:Uncharacterized protein n=1 Tax=Coptis chinensis TaxID=261450 RepID=A0A835LRW7_9MAGN|nr:hypothetical protein IFM89_030505 [Coptis chinensis]
MDFRAEEESLYNVMVGPNSAAERSEGASTVDCDRAEGVGGRTESVSHEEICTKEDIKGEDSCFSEVPLAEGHYTGEEERKIGVNGGSTRVGFSNIISRSLVDEMRVGSGEELAAVEEGADLEVRDLISEVYTSEEVVLDGNIESFSREKLVLEEDTCIVDGRDTVVRVYETIPNQLKENLGEICVTVDSSQVHSVGDVNSFSGIGVTKGHPSEDEEGESGVEVVKEGHGAATQEVLVKQIQGSSLELAALGPGTVVCDYMSYVFMFLSIATSNMVATSIAREENHKISILLFVGFTCGVGMLLLTKVTGAQILTAFTGPKNLSIVPAANTYVQIQGLAWPSILVGWVAQSASLGMGIIRGIGDIVLCCFLGYGIVGAAWATMVSQIIAAFMMIESLNKKGFNAYSIPVPSPKELLKIFELAASVFITMISKHGALSFLDSHSYREV